LTSPDGFFRLLLVLLLCGGAFTPCPGSAGSPPSRLDFRISTLPGGGQPFAIVAADLDHNGKTDLAVTNPTAGRISLYFGAGDGSFSAPRHIDTGKQPRGIVAADFNGDETADLAVAATRHDEVVVHLGAGGGTFQSGRRVRVGRRPFMLAAVDLDANGATDLAVANEGEAAEGNALSVLLGDGQGGFAHTAMPAGRFASDVAAADFNGDGHVDLAVAAWGSNDVIVRFGRGDGTFPSTARFTYAEGHGIYRVLAADLDRDGKADMAWNDLRRSGLYLLYGDGAGGFPRTRSLLTDAGVRHAVAADMDGDGWPDLVSTNTGADTISLLMADGRGGFLPRQNISVGSVPRMVAVADLDRDGRLDAVVTNMRSNDLHVLLNTGRGQGTEPPRKPRRPRREG
jgi:hypothetical protein